MSRRARDPIAAVIEYFKTAPQDAAEAVLAICTVEVHSRRPMQPGPVKRKTARKTQETQPAAE